jgi:hypothetical protein
LYYIYIDESEDTDRFLVGGIVTTNRDSLLDAIFDTRRFIKSKKGLSDKTKQKLLNELKDYYLNSSFEDIKTEFLKNILYAKIKSKNKAKSNTVTFKNNIKIICAYYQKIDLEYFNQQRKEDVYIKCVLEILNQVNGLDAEVQLIYDMVYDELGDKSFRKKLEDRIKEQHSNVNLIRAGKSNEIKELQAADICIGCVRRNLNGENLDNYSIIAPSVILRCIDLEYNPLKYIKK